MAILVFWVDPQVLADFPLPSSYLLFFLMIFLAVFFLMSLLLGNSRRGFLVALGVIILGYLRLWGLWGWGKIVFLLVTLAAFEVYFSGRKE